VSVSVQGVTWAAASKDHEGTGLVTVRVSGSSRQRLAVCLGKASTSCQPTLTCQFIHRHSQLGTRKSNARDISSDGNY
jgi:hypothetical protein